MINALRRISKIEWTAFGIIVSFHAWWPLWSYTVVGTTTIHVFLCYILVLYGLFLTVKYKRFRIQNKSAVVFLFLWFFCVPILRTAHLSYLFIIGSYIFAMNLQPHECKTIVRMVTIYLAVSILISLPPWVYNQFIAELTPLNTLEIAWKGVDSTYINYGLFVAPLKVSDALRFYSLFDEPGTLGTISAFILWANKYNFKDKYNLIILLGAFCTFSLAFYILTIIGWMIDNRKSLTKIFMAVFVLALIGGILMYVFRDYLAFQDLIIYRLNNMDEAGVDHRTSDQVNKIWDNMKISPNLFLGYGTTILERIEGAGASYKLFFIEFGLIGFVVLAYSYLKLGIKKNRFVLLTFFIFCISFLQRPLLFTAWQFMLFACIVKGRAYETEQNSEFRLGVG